MKKNLPISDKRLEQFVYELLSNVSTIKTHGTTWYYFPLWIQEGVSGFKTYSFEQLPEYLKEAVQNIREKSGDAKDS